MDNREKELIDLVCRMVRTASVNPGDRAEFSAPYGEMSLAEFVAGWLDRADLKPEIQTIVPGRANVFCLAPGKQADKTLLLCAHLDTVDVQGMEDPFSGSIRDGRIRGRGSCDDKGPLGALLMAFRDRVVKGDLPCNLAILADAGEEDKLVGTRFFLENPPVKPTAVLIGEPTGMEVVRAHKGAIRMRLTTHGRSVHSSTPSRGENAIYKMAPVLDAIREFAEELNVQTSHDLLGSETLAATCIQGGHQVNVIPDRCQVQLDWRTLPKGQAEDYLKQLKEGLSSRGITDIEIQADSLYESMETGLSHGLVQKLLPISQQAGGCGQAKGAPYATDASAFSRYGIPAVIFGPGDVSQAHTQDETIEIDQLQLGLRGYDSFLAGQDWGL